jgi:hypothetical protein
LAIFTASHRSKTNGLASESTIKYRLVSPAPVTIRALSTMSQRKRSVRSISVITPWLVALGVAAACAPSVTDDLGDISAPSTGTGGSTGGDHSSGTGANAGSPATGGTSATGGSGVVASGGSSAGRGPGAVGSGGSNGGKLGAAGRTGGATGGTVGMTSGTGGTTGASGRASGTGATFGRGGAGGRAGFAGGGGTVGSGAAAGTGGPSTGGASTLADDPCSVTTAPTGGTPHATNNASGMAAGLAWTIWSNGSGGSITTYSTPAFSAAWNNSGDFLARMGLQWNDSKTYDQYGTITAQFSSKKSGSGGGYSYIGIYGWSTNPCIEWYIVDDSYNKMPVNPGNTSNKGTAMIDGGSYTLYSRPTSGTGGSKCSGVSSWTQFYSVRQTARQCGTISISQHFDAWKAAGMTLGKMDQAQILVEVGGGSGNIDFALANITTSQ